MTRVNLSKNHNTARTILGLIQILFVSFSSLAEEVLLTLEEAKVHYSLEVAKQIEWPNDKSLEQIVIGVVGNDPQIVNAFLQNQPFLIRGKSIKVESFNESNLAENHHNLIYVPHNKRTRYSQLYNTLSNALFIVDGRTSQQEQMINLIDDRSNINIRMNRENLTSRGFVVSVNLLELAGTKEDLSEQLREWELELRTLTQQVQSKEKDLEILNTVLVENSNKLELAKLTLEKNKKTLQDNQTLLYRLTQEIKSSEKSVEENKQYISEQKKLISRKQHELLENEQAVNRLKNNIEENKKILAQQLSKIAHQSKTIEAKDETILTQRSWIIAILLVTLLFFLAIYFLLKINGLRRKANKELQQLNSQLYELATTDGLSNLNNRRYFLEAAQNELLRQQRHDFHSVLLMIDIDYFKSVNDIYGHAMGDEAIKSIANILKESMRKYDLVGRIGGEEFAMMLVDCDIEQAYDIAMRLCDRVEQFKVSCEGTSINVTISIGLSQLRPDDTQIQQALIRADKALYIAKNDGRNRAVVFSE